MIKFSPEDKRSIFKSVIVIAFIGLLVLLIYQGYMANQEQKMQEIVSKYADNGMLVYGADDSAPPLRFIDEDGKYKGVVPDYMNLISIELGIHIECVPYKWNNALEAIKTGQTDMIDLFISPDRSKYMEFTKPLYTLRTIMVTNRNQKYRLDEINNLEVATQMGDYANTYLKEHYPNVKLVYVHDVGEGLNLLINNKVDAVIGDEPVAQYYADKLGIKNRIRTINTSLYEKPVVIGVSKDKADLVKPLNRAIDKINRSGQPDKIQQIWFGISTPLLKTGNSVSQFFKYLSLIVILVAFIFGIKLIENRFLKMQVRLRTRELEESRNELALIFNEMPEGILVIDKNGKIQSANELVASFVGLRFEDIISMNCEDYIKKMNTAQTKEIIEAVHSHNTGAVIQAEKGHLILKVKLLDMGGERTKDIIMTIEDTTADVIKNNQLLQSSKMIAVGQLAAGMAHQLRNPLGIIRTHSYLLSINDSVNSKGKDSIRYIDDSAKRAGSIVDNVMNFWRMSESGVSSINLKNFINSLIMLNYDEINKRSLNIDLDCEDDLMIQSSQESLKHILMNLIQNAIEAVEEKVGIIIVRAYEDQDNIIIECEDNGCGIAKDNIEYLFNPFFTTKPPGKGTGLGLYVVYSEIKYLGGDIVVNSALGKGTRFSIKLKNQKDA